MELNTSPKWCQDSRLYFRYSELKIGELEITVIEITETKAQGNKDKTKNEQSLGLGGKYQVN